MGIAVSARDTSLVIVAIVLTDVSGTADVTNTTTTMNIAASLLEHELIQAVLLIYTNV